MAENTKLTVSQFMQELHSAVNTLEAKLLALPSEENPNPNPEPQPVRKYFPGSEIYKPVDKSTLVPAPQIGSVRNAYEDYATKVYRTTKSDIHPIVTVTNRYSGRKNFWAIPKGAEFTKGSDHRIVIVDQEKVMEIWDGEWNSDKTAIRAGGNHEFPFEGNGISNPPNYRVTASGFSSMNGMVIEEDFIENGQIDVENNINHALIMAFPHRFVSKSFVAPAVGAETKGSAGPSGFPMGARFTFKDLDINKFQLHPFARKLLQAINQYGVFLIDTNGTPLLPSGKGIGNITVETGLMTKLYGVTGDDLEELILRIQDEVENVLTQYPLHRAS